MFADLILLLRICPFNYNVFLLFPFVRRRCCHFHPCCCCCHRCRCRRRHPQCRVIGCPCCTIWNTSGNLNQIKCNCLNQKEISLVQVMYFRMMLFHRGNNHHFHLQLLASGQMKLTFSIDCPSLILLRNLTHRRLEHCQPFPFQIEGGKYLEQVALDIRGTRESPMLPN